MALPTVTGILDEINGVVNPIDTGEWDDYSTWDAWGVWEQSPADPLVWLADVIDLGEVQDFVLEINTVANGTVSYDVYVSDTGQFNGEETVTAIDQDDSGIGAFRGRFVLVAVKVAITSGVNTLNNVEITASNRTIDIKLNAVDTSTLAGTVNARQLSLPRTPAKVVHMQITPQEVSAFNIDAYVTAYPTSTQLIPRIVSRTVPVSIALQARDGVDRDGVCDVLLSVLPEQFMQGNNLRIR
jgi:hypothetical protein